ncbi:hypothetical protein [Nitrosomonas communis]|uniref:Uncharacterized protein n=1 Tax=Nitrosomonas communis TaxID=44574 RepID=A0A1I4NJJ0_9PROT|nr:hypothetical protein [Nitrosomonas communis]SFM15626.1 hypothetical protein SAMN05421863_101529 [Nitrosomonas communis]
MKTKHVFLTVAASVSIIFFSVLSIIGFPKSMEGWIVSDVILGVILYLSYLVVVPARDTSRNEYKRIFG